MATSETIIESNRQQNLCQVYVTEWKLTNLLGLKSKKIQTPAFSPVPNLDLQFCYEAYFQVYQAVSYDHFYSIFKSSLVKLNSTGVPPSMKLQVDLRVKYSNGLVFKEYSELPAVSVQEMDCFYFDDVFSIYKINNVLHDHGSKLGTTGTLIVHCHLEFFDAESIYFSPEVLSSLKTLNISAEDIESLNRTDDKSDVVVRVDGKSFLAHKAVLASYSPVFKKMLFGDSQHSTGSITVSNSTSEVFNLFLDYLYSGDFDNKSWTTVRDLYVLSVKYEVSTLKETCSAAIMSLLSVSNICEVLGIAFDYGDVILKDAVTKFVAKHVGDH